MFSVQGLVEYLLRFMKYKRNYAKPKEKLQCDDLHKNNQKVMEQARETKGNKLKIMINIQLNFIKLDSITNKVLTNNLKGKFLLVPTVLRNKCRCSRLEMV